MRTDFVAHHAPRAERIARLVEWKPWAYGNGSALIGHCSVAFSGGWVVHRVPVFRTRDGGLGVGTPSIAELDAGGRIKTRDGKCVYSAVISFEKAAARERWQSAVLAALNQRRHRRRAATAVGGNAMNATSWPLQAEPLCELTSEAEDCIHTGDAYLALALRCYAGAMSDRQMRLRLEHIAEGLADDDPPKVARTDAAVAFTRHCVRAVVPIEQRLKLFAYLAIRVPCWSPDDPAEIASLVRSALAAEGDA